MLAGPVGPLFLRGISQGGEWSSCTVPPWPEMGLSEIVDSSVITTQPTISECCTLCSSRGCMLS